MSGNYYRIANLLIQFLQTHYMLHFRICNKLGLVYLGMLMACSAATPPEQAVRNNIADIEAAVESQSSRKIMGHLSPKFHADNGFDREQLRGLILAQFLRNKSISILLPTLEVEVNNADPRRVSMVGSAIITGTDRWLPDSGRAVEFSGEWRLEDDVWLLSRLQWK